MISFLKEISLPAKRLLYLLAVSGMLTGASCNSSKKMVDIDPEDIGEADPISFEALDSLIYAWTGEQPEVETAPASGVSLDIDTTAAPLLRPSAKRENDLLHTKLEVKFDWAKQRVIGKATLALRPYFRPTSTLTLDAKNFDIKSVILEGSNKILKYKYDGQQMTITLDRTYTNKEEYRITIDYIAKPNEGAVGGSAAITQDKGLYFINADGSDPNKPKQIWTQGETESNSRWFPTIDKPNERCTQELYITVEDKYKTLSNGLLISSTPNTDGTRTDYWRMNKPHAPYLFMLAVGDFAMVTEKWNGIDLQYFVEPEYEKDVQAIFPYTGEMLTFYSQKLGVPYPWQKYGQIAVRDYVSGAMENTTAVLFGEYMQGHAEDLVDVEANELVVAHEMFHHWFGDLVTCESWSNLTLNEGFANYGEYLWVENKYGRDQADQHRKQELDGYLTSVSSGEKHPLIHYQYDDREDMFDAHSYNKGGLVLHMLRSYIGDDAFFKALNLYLTRYAYTDVEAHELRMAFEEVTGEDLNWFWNQWYFSEGHPAISISQVYDVSARKLRLTVQQTQTPSLKQPPVFVLPTFVDIHVGGTVRHEPILVTQRIQEFSFDVPREPDLVVFDPSKNLLAEVDFKKTEAELNYQFAHAASYFERIEVLDKLAESKSQNAIDIFRKALSDPSYGIRIMALSKADIGNKDVEKRISEMAVSDPNANVRQAAVNTLAATESKAHVAALSRIAKTDKATRVALDAFQAIMDLDSKEAAKIAPRFENSKDVEMLPAIAVLYGTSEDTTHLGFFEHNLSRVKGYAQLPYLISYGFLVARATPAKRDATIELFKQMLEDKKQPMEARVGSFAAIRAVAGELLAINATDALAPKLNEYLQKILEGEQDAQTKGVFQQVMERDLKAND